MLSIEDNLDYGVEMKKPDDGIQNPFYKHGITKMTNRELYSTFKTLYILCLDNNINKIDNIFYEKTMSNERFELSKSQFVLVKGNIKMLSNINHKRSIAVVDKQFLDNYNHHFFDLNDQEIVLIMHNISESDVELYTKLYTGHNKIDDYIRLRLLMDYFNCSKHNMININLRQMIYNSEETGYWMNDYNCKLNMTNAFIKRGFRLDISSVNIDPEIKKVIEKINSEQNDDENYLKDIHREKIYVDASSAVKKNGFRIYKISENEDINISYEEVNELFSNFDSERDRYDMFNMFMLSKKYCHLVINNGYVLNIMNPIIKKFMPLYKYLWGYAWVTFYLEECIKKTKTTIKDRYVFDIDVANKLPFFPYCSTDIHMNPYTSLLVSKSVLNYENNLQGLKMISGYPDYGISTLEQFKTNFNIFSTNTPNFSIFENLDWSNVAVTGSVMTACIPKKHPLIDQFKVHANSKERSFRYFQEYYPTSDIDMMCNHSSVFDFIDKANEVYECVKNNIAILHGDVGKHNIKLEPYKTLVIIVSTKYVIENMPEYKLEEVIENKHTNEIKEIFYCKYVAKKTEQNMIERKIKSNKIYKDHYNIVPIDNLKLLFTEYKIDPKNDKSSDEKNKYYIGKPKEAQLPSDLAIVLGKPKEALSKKNIELIDDESSDDLFSQENDDKASNILTGKEDDNDEEIYFKISENLKYKIESQFILHKVEIFQTLYPDFFSCVSRFHLPCVRSFYDGNTVYLLPSAITAYMTMTNTDYKYFSGTKDPIEIINKNKGRGWGTCVNDPEKIHTIEYSRNVKKWQNLMQINIKDKKSITSIFGGLEIDNRIFKPRRFNSYLYHDCFPVDDQYSDEKHTYVHDIHSLENEYKIRYGYDVSKSGLNLLKYKTINEQGYINPIKSWIIDAAYEELA